MDIQKIERRLKRINAVLDTFKEDNKISAIEQDLLLGYVRELYDLIKHSDADEVVHKAIPAPEPIIKEVIVEKIIEKIVEVPVQVPANVVNQVAAKQEVVAEVVKEEVPVQKVEEKKVEAPVEVKVHEEKHEETKHAPAASHGKASKALEAIFVMEEINDLSDKLSMLKINDIMQAIGINKKFEFVNELFNGNTDLFNKTIKKINECGSFDEAKNILINEVAIPFEWEKEEKLKEGQQLVKLVRRKFS